MITPQIIPASWLSKAHRDFITLTHTEATFRGFLNTLFLFIIPLIPHSQIIVIKHKQNIIGGAVLSSLYITSWALSTPPERTEMFNYFKQNHYLYFCFAIIQKSHRKQGIFTQLFKSISQQKLFFITKAKAIEDLALKHGAKHFTTKNGNHVPNQTNQGKTHYLYLNQKT